MIAERQPQGELEGIHFSGYSGTVMWRNVLLIISAAMFLASCSSAGRKFDITAMDRIVVNQTTDREVLAMLGEPLSEKELVNGIKVYKYAYGKKRFSGFGTSLDSLEIQCYKGVVISKRQEVTGDFPF